MPTGIDCGFVPVWNIKQYITKYSAATTGNTTTSAEGLESAVDTNNTVERQWTLQQHLRFPVCLFVF